MDTWNADSQQPPEWFDFAFSDEDDETEIEKILPLGIV